MTTLQSDPASVAMRRDVILNTLREHPWSKPTMLTRIIGEETGGFPTMWTGALYIPYWTIYRDLVALEKQGKVERRTITTKNVLWRAVEA